MKLALALTGNRKEGSTEACSLQLKAERYLQGQEETPLKMVKAICNRIIDKYRNKNHHC